MDQSSLLQCQKLIEYQFKDAALLGLALTHSSVAPTRLHSNERLEFLGDSILGIVVCEDLYQRYGHLLEGEMTRIKSAVVSRHTCALVAQELGLGELLHLGKGLVSASGLPQSIAAAVLEAIIGAIYLDGGLEAARIFILRHMLPHIQATFDNHHMRNYKSLLQQLAQCHFGCTPLYQVLDEKGPDHSKCFELAVAIGGRQFPSAWGKSKKEAEQKAAMRAMEELEKDGLIASDTPAAHDTQ